MKKNNFIVICLIFLLLLTFIGCKRTSDDFTFGEKVSSDSSQYQYDIYFDKNNVDIRIVNIKEHEYVVASSYIGRGGGISIIHSESCECKKKNE